MDRKRTVSEGSLTSQKKLRIDKLPGTDSLDEASDSDLDVDEDEQLGIDEDGDGVENTGLGTIKCVELSNFMCHSSLKMDLGPNINFITGQNGSGKSAILTAITVALGGKATFTNRATSISKLLKEGTDIGQVIVTLRNNGSEAFQFRVYGNSIIIERRIPRDGAATYKIKSACGKIITTRRQDLLAILDHLRIDVENPMAILTQDTARMFLANSSPQEKYAFFLRGTQLERLMSEYGKINKDYETMKKLIHRKSEVLPEIKNELRVMENRWKEMEHFREREFKVNELQAEQIWSKICALEKNKETQEENGSNLSAQMKDAEGIFRKQKDIIDSRVPMIEDLKKRYQCTGEKIRPLNVDDQEVLAQSRIIAEECRQAEAISNEINSNIAKHYDSIKDLQSRIDNETRKLNVDHQAIANDRNHQIRVLEQHIALEKVKRSDACQEIDVLLKSGPELERKVQIAEDQRNRAKKEIEQIHGNIRDIQAQIKDSLRAFGPNMSNVVRDTTHARWVGQQPIGPFGNYCSLKETKYQSVIESNLNKILNSFSVENDQDYKALQNILRQNRCNSSIYKYKVRRDFDYSSGLPSRDLKSMLDVLQIDHPVVLQQLIINASIEKTIIVDSHEDGDRLTGGNWPMNVSAVYTPDCYQIGSKSGGYSSNTISVYRGPPRLSQDIESALAERRDYLQIKESGYNRLKDQVNQSIENFDSIRNHHRKFENEKMSAERQIRSIENQVRNIKDNMESTEIANIGALEDMLKEEQKSVKIYEVQKVTIDEELGDKQRLLSDSNSNRSSIKRQIEVEKSALLEIQKEIEKCETELSRAVKEMKYYDRKKTEYKSMFEACVENIRKLEEFIAERVEECLQYSPRVYTKRSSEEIEQELVRVNAYLKEKEKEFGSRVIFSSKLEKQRQTFRLISAELKEFTQLLSGINQSRKIREDQLERFRFSISLNAKRIFSRLIDKRGYRGILELDHKNLSLKLQVDVNGNGVDADREEQGSRDAKALSGGEKSYATVCLLLALWEAMPSPFRALDEFDVFMDAANRQLAMKLMVDNARESANKSQYILISPQSTSNSDLSGPDIQIKLMRPPERGQTTLNFNALPK